jgi:hypothetical protein
LVLCIAFLACAAQAAAAEPEPDGNVVREAKERYARGLHLFENGDNGGALAEFDRAHELVPSRLLLYRIALVYVAMDKPVDALESLDEVLSDPGPLKPEYLARAKAAREEQQRRIGELDVKVNVAAAIEIDGARAGEAPLSAPLPVAAGEHIVAVVAPGYIPLRQSVTVAARGRAELAFDLQPTEAKLAHVTVHSAVPGAEFRVDDELVGKTPIADPVTVLPGRRVIEMQRPGYMSARRVLNLGDGVYSTVAFDPDEDSSADVERGQLRVAAGTGDVHVTIDGRSRGTYRQPIDLPAGLHVVKLERTGFEPLERLAEVPANGEAEVKVSLRPSGKVREAQAARAHSYKGWAVAALVSGALVAGGSVGLALWSNSKLSPAEDSLALAQKDATAGGSCDPSKINNDEVKKLCTQRMADRQSQVDKYKNLRLEGIIGTVAGAALVGVGVTLLLTAPADPGRDDRDDTLAGALVPVLSAGPDGASRWLRGQF